MANLPIDLLIFDLDGTLADTRKDLTNAVNYARKQFGLSKLNIDTVMQYVGQGARRLLERALPPEHQNHIDEALKNFCEYYTQHALDFTTLYPSVRETLEHFKNKKMAVISNKPEDLSRIVLQGLGIDTYFDLILGGDSLTVMKPDPEPIFHVLRELEVKPERAVMIGDGTTDMEAGKQAGVHTCAVTYGYRPRETLLASEPEFVIDDMKELISLFN